jgi:dihydrofolate synthase/folylpolyglutamate synthase
VTWSPGEAFAWLDRHVNLEAISARRVDTPSLDRIRALIEVLGSPHEEYPAVHVTGTNGKTSTARIIAALLAARLPSVGLYTSPHLERVNERISWAGEPISDEDLAEVLASVALAEQARASNDASYFELLTAAGLRWFADVAIDAAVVEVGLGGTWDATNIVDGRVAVVTNVSVDHVEYLGPTRESIATEKAGIIKPGATLVLGETDPALVPIFVDRPDINVVQRDRDFGVHANRIALGGRVLDLYTPAASYDDVFLALHGSHQGDNAAIALAAVEAFFDGEPLDPDVVAEAFATVRSPGRLEVVRREPLVLLDGAHNVAGAHALVAALAEGFAAGDRTLVVGLLREKEPHEMLEALDVAGAARVVVCPAPSPRAHEVEVVAKAATEVGVDPSRIEVATDVASAVEQALEATPLDGQIVVTGSLYVVGAARAALR